MNPTPTDPGLFEAVRARVGEILAGGEGCHDFDHTLRVLHNARMLAAEEHCSADELAMIELAALLHDCARPEEFESGGRLCHAELGAAKAEKILRELGCTDEDLIRTVCDAVRCHRFRGKARPQTTVSRILHDADKLDSIGAVGIGRAFHFAGKLGARLHNTEAEALASDAYSREDTAYREYLVKLRRVPGRMTTEAGRRHARDRADFMHDFFRRMNDGE
ncbi:MAG: HD domain-containing protein [Lentisphaeria bacterium]|nr:HD domain-containing protein [Lentisphaeria bacterium]